MSTSSTRPSPPAPAALDRIRALVDPALRTAVATLADSRMRQIASYQMGWIDADGTPTPGGGKAIRPALAVLSAEAVGASPHEGVPPAVALELIHNFSLLHDDVLDNDVERRHRPTGWVVFGTGQAILAGTAMLALAVEVLDAAGPAGHRCLGSILGATQDMIGGQSLDIAIEGRLDVTLEEVLHMEAGKTAALLSCGASVGAIAGGATPEIAAGLAEFGRQAGIAFQLVDDILGIAGDPGITGKSVSSDVRAGKCSAPIVAALHGDGPAARQLAELFAAGPPSTEDDIARATMLIHEAGGIEWAAARADAHYARALAELKRLDLPNRTAVAELRAVADFIVNRGR